MKQHLHRRLVPLGLLVLLGLLLAASLPAYAVLGAAPTLLQPSAARSKSTLAVVPRAQFSVQEQQLASGTVVREFVAPDNKVFAVAWQGPFMPDLQAWLGSYFPDYATAAAARRSHAGRRPLALQKSELVVHAGGRMRAFHGEAYLPAQLPPGVTPADIR